MAQWKIRQTVDLAASGSTPTAWSEALMTDGDKNAHTWTVTVMDDGLAANLVGMAAMCYFNRADHVTVPVAGTIRGNQVSVTTAFYCHIKFATFLPCPAQLCLKAVTFRTEAGDELPQIHFAFDG